MLDSKQEARLAELVKKKSKQKLDDKEFKEFKLLSKLAAKREGNPKLAAKKEDSFGGPGNSIEWWNKEEALFRDSTNVASNWIAGTPIAAADIPFVPAGVLRVILRSMYGASMSATDPINVWARDLYLKFFQKWRGAGPYTASDLGITQIAGIELFKLICKYERIYGVINRYSKRNVNMPVCEEAALGITSLEAAYLRTHLSDFRYDLNVLIKRAQRICILKDMSVLADALSLFGYEYLDHDNTKAQIIVFDVVDHGIYSDTRLTTGGSIEFCKEGVDYNLFDFNADNMCEFLTVAMDALLGSDSVQRIYGDLVAWFGEDALLEFKPVDEDLISVPVYREEMLHKLHNMESVNNWGTGQSTAVYSVYDQGLPSADKTYINGLIDKSIIHQYNDCICTKIGFRNIATPVSQQTVNGYTYQVGGTTVENVLHDKAHVLDTYRVEVGAEVVAEGCCFKQHCEKVSTYDTFECTSGLFYYVSQIDTFTLANGVVTNVNGWTVMDTGDSVFAAATAGSLAIIDWAPLMYVIDTATGIIGTLYGDIDTPIPLYANTLSRIHTAMFYSGMKSGYNVVTK